MPRWNWPDPAVNAVDFLANAAEYPTLLNGLARTISLTREEKQRILTAIAEGKLSAFQLSELQKILRQEQRKFSDLDRRHWPRLMEMSIRHFGEWLELWCERGFGEKQEVMAALFAGERDEYLGVWSEIAYFWYRLADLPRAEERWPLAEAAYLKAIELDAKYAPGWHNLGNLLKTHLGRYEESEAAYLKAIELDATYALPWHGLGNLFKNHLGRYDESEAAYLKAIELDATYVLPWNGLAAVCLRLGRHAEAREALAKAMELAPENADYAQAAAELALVEGDFDSAGAGLARAEPLLKEDEERRNQLMLRLALALGRGGAPEVGEAHRALRRLGESMETPSTWLYEELEPAIDRLPEAAANLLRQWIRAVKHDPEADPQAAYRAYRDGDEP